MAKNVLLLILLLPLFLTAFEWPVENKVVTATFGEKRWDHFHTGIDIGGGEQDVHPAEDGEIVYSFEEGSSSRIPSGMGNFIVLEHQRGLRTLYAHLKENTIKHDTPDVKIEDIIAVSGNSGGSLGTHLHFEVIDSELKEIINPLLILPQLKDKVYPKIINVMIKDNDEIKKVINGRVTVKSGIKTLMVEAYDLSPWVQYYCPVAPYSVSVFLNSEELFNYKYERLMLKDNIVVLNNDKSSGDYYDDTWLFSVGDMTLIQPRNTAKIIIKDINGNEASKIVYINVEE